MLKKAGLLQPLLLASLLGAGFGIVWSLVGSWTTEVVQKALREPQELENLRFLADGTPVIQAYGGPQFAVLEYRDLAGNSVPVADNAPMLTGPLLAAGPEKSPSLEELTWAERLFSFSDDRRPPHYWFLLADGDPAGTGYFIGYDSLSKARVGFLGTAGFRPDLPPPDERFPCFGSVPALGIGSVVISPQYHGPGARYPQREGLGSQTAGIPGWLVYLVANDQKIYQIDLSQRTVRVAVENVPIRSAGLVLEWKGPRELIYWLAVRTADQVLVLDERNQVLRRYPLPEELRDQTLNWAETSTGEVIAYQQGPFDNLRPTVTYRVYRLNRAGQITRREVVALPYSGYQPYWPFAFALVAPMAAVVDVTVLLARPIDLLQTRQSDSYGQALSRSVVEFWPALVLGQLVSAGLAWACYRRQRRFAVHGVERFLWPGFVFLFGLPGWVGYRYGRSWPILERCPHCRAEAPRDRVPCAVCQTEFPMPPLRGTEVFA